jgi:two-component system, chemotaxis family, response regulator Rcp1
MIEVNHIISNLDSLTDLPGPSLCHPGAASNIPRGMVDLPRILHIDDQESDRLLFQRAFQASGLKAELVSLPDAFEALNFLDQTGTSAGGEPPYLIVLDLTLPQVDGRDFLTYLRTHPRYQSIPLVVLTGSFRESDKRRCEELQVDQYVVKPFTTTQLATLIPTFAHWLTRSDHS